MVEATRRDQIGNWLLVIGGAAAIAVAAFFVMSASGVGAFFGTDGPLLAADPPEVFVPQSYAGRSAPASVGLRNLTGRSVRVVGVHTSCVCVAPDDTFPFTLAAHQERRVSFSAQVPADGHAGDALATITFYVEAASQSVHVQLRVGSG